MDPIAKKAANLRVLQRHDAAVADILDAASHVVAYRFDDDKEAWVGAPLGFRGSGA